MPLMTGAQIIWTRLDALARCHPKILRAGAVPCWLWVCGIMWCNTQKAHDGFIPSEVIPTLYPIIPPEQLDASVAVLIRVGLWEQRADGVQTHDYNDFQPTADELARMSGSKAEAGRRGGLKSGETRRRKGETKQNEAPASKQDEALASEATHEATKPGPIRSDPVRSEPASETRARGVVSTTDPGLVEPPWVDEAIASVELSTGETFDRGCVWSKYQATRERDRLPMSAADFRAFLSSWAAKQKADRIAAREREASRPAGSRPTHEEPKPAPYHFEAPIAAPDVEPEAPITRPRIIKRVRRSESELEACRRLAAGDFIHASGGSSS